MKYISIVLAIITMLSTYPFILLLWREGVSMPFWLRLLFGAIVLMGLFVGIVGLVDSSKKNTIMSVLLILLNVAILLYITHGIVQSINKKVVLKETNQTTDQGNPLMDVGSLADSGISDEGLIAIVSELKKQNKNPADFYAKMITELSPTVVSYELIHKDSLKPENINKIGNPSGKDMKASYSFFDKKVTLLLSQ